MQYSKLLLNQAEQTQFQRPNSFAALRGFMRERAPTERCDVCGVGLPEEHPHLFEPASRQLICTCEECAVSVGLQGGGSYRRVPHQVRFLPEFHLAEAQWDGLLIPVGMAFFFYNTPAGRVMAFYPSPAGATESLLSLETWQELVQDNPVLAEMEPDVEALLVNRVQGAQEYFIAPIDKCYELVGLIRANWRGLSGGAEVWDQIGSFYTRLKEQSNSSF